MGVSELHLKLETRNQNDAPNNGYYLRRNPQCTTDDREAAKEVGEEAVACRCFHSALPLEVRSQGWLVRGGEADVS